MVNVVIVQPFRLANDSFERESQTLGYGAAAGIFGGALDSDAIHFPRRESMKNECATACSHDALSLMGLVQPIAESSPAVCPIDIHMVDHSAEASFEPRAGAKSSVVCEMLEPSRDEPFHVSR